VGRTLSSGSAAKFLIVCPSQFNTAAAPTTMAKRGACNPIAMLRESAIKMPVARSVNELDDRDVVTSNTVWHCQQANDPLWAVPVFPACMAPQIGHRKPLSLMDEALPFMISSPWVAFREPTLNFAPPRGC
jgi:hypothetical protein